MTNTATQPRAAPLLRAVGAARQRPSEIAAEIRCLETTIEWAVLNEVDPAGPPGFFGDRPIPLAGAGAPLVSEFAAMEYAAALGMSDRAGNA